MRTRASDSVLEVKDVSLKIKDKQILHNLRCTARSGDLLAVMGPTGSGKTTLLNVISGRLKPDRGDVILNGSNFNKRGRRRMAFVQQQDVFFSHLTVWETLYFSAQIRLPDTYTEKQKKQRIDEIIDALDIRKCLQTVIGDVFVRGISGGEKKRTSIGCELLTDPDIMLLDEPTSGLDSSMAFSLMERLKSYAINFNKTIITTIHQPSSQIYHMFNNLLLLVDGHEAYWGPSRDATSYFSSLNLHCEPNYNPADFMLGIVKSNEETKHLIISAAESRSIRNILPTNSTPSSHIPVRNDKNNFEIKSSDGNTQGLDLQASNNEGDEKKIDDQAPTDKEESTKDVQIHISQLEEDSDIRTSLMQGLDMIPNGKHKISSDEETRKRWPTSWWTQYKMLCWRGFKQTKGVLKQGFTIAQILIVTAVVGMIYFQIDMEIYSVRDVMGLTKGVLKQGFTIAHILIVTAVVGLIYWQIDMEIYSVRDVMGLLFFVVAYWTFNPAFECITQFPAEKGVLSKERSSGAYRLSAYYFAKMTSDLPLTFILPTVMFTLLFFLAGLGGAAEFFLSLLVIYLQVLISQAFGFMLAVLCKDLRFAFTTMVSYSLSAFMIGGFFTQRIPHWIQWAKYLSHMLYPFNIMCNIIFAQMPAAPCNTTSIELYPQCGTNTTTHIYPQDVLHKAGITLPIYCYIISMFIIVIALRSIGYVILRVKRQTIL